jgi:hypothetical protein
MPAELLDDLRRSRAPLIWIGHGLDPELARNRGVEVLPYRAVRFVEIAHRGLAVRGSAAPAPLLAIAREGQAQVLATGHTADGFEAPWAVQSGNFAAFAEAPWSSGDSTERHLIFADLMFDLLMENGVAPRRRALIRVEGITADTSPRRLRALADVLRAERVAFELTVGSRLEPLLERAQLADALRYATARGGVLALRAPAAAPPGGMPAAPFETVDGDGALVIPANLFSPEQVERNLAVRDSMLSYSHRWDADPERLGAILAELRRFGYQFVTPRDVVRAAPAHADLPLPRASMIAVASAGWLAALPWIDVPVLVSLLALVTAMWLGGEMLLAALDRRKPRCRGHGFPFLKPKLRDAQVVQG